MCLPLSVKSAISEWFWKLRFNNNAAPIKKQSSNVSSTGSATIPRRANFSWKYYYQQIDDGNTSLHWACMCSNENEFANILSLAPHPSYLDIQNDNGFTPLHLATLTLHTKIIRTLLVAGADPAIRDHRGNTALHLACRAGAEDCVLELTRPISEREILDHDRVYGYHDSSNIRYSILPSDLEILNYNGDTCVHIAAQGGFVNILRTLVFYKADINAVNKDGNTALHIAVENSNKFLVEYLFNECPNLNPETVSDSHLTAFQLAILYNQRGMEDILRRHGVQTRYPGESTSSDYCEDSGTDSGY